MQVSELKKEGKRTRLGQGQDTNMINQFSLESELHNNYRPTRITAQDQPRNSKNCLQ